MLIRPESRRSQRQIYGACVCCGANVVIVPGVYQCECSDQSNLRVVTALDETVRQRLVNAVRRPVRLSLWRYAALLATSEQFRSPLHVGGTPLVCATTSGPSIFFKDETRNPSGSIKDRASETVLAFAQEHGIDEVVVASTGNAAASLACVGAATGIKVRIVVPADVPPAKMAQIAAYGPEIYAVPGPYDLACEIAMQMTRRSGIFNRTTGFNPLTRDGKKTCAFEIVEQLGWKSPDWVVVPTGDGNILSALWQGFEELYLLGLTKKKPRMIAAQSSSSNAIAREFAGKAGPLPPSRSIADSISVRYPRDLIAAIDALRRSNGLPIVVDDEQIRRASIALARQFGCFVEPSAAASYAALTVLLENTKLADTDVAVCVLTGSGLKDSRGALSDNFLDQVVKVSRSEVETI